MILRYIYDERLAQASYLVGDPKSKEALVIDPARNIEPYLQIAKQEGLRITQVAETHIHADFVSGSRELAAHTGATIYLSDMGDKDWKYTFAAPATVNSTRPASIHLLRDGDQWTLGKIRLEAIHTPGHTPEHLAFMLTDLEKADQPMGIFTGDFLFVGDVGRPDLLETAVGLMGTAKKGACQQYQNIQRFATLPDYLQIWPGHGAGSACGKALGAVPSSTLGYEKLFNPAFRFDKVEEFVEWLLTGQPETPRYFAQMKRVNKEGPALLQELAQPARLQRADLDALLDGGAQVFDLRSAEGYSTAYIPGTLSIPATSKRFSTYAGWFVDYKRPLYLILPSLADAPEILNTLRAIGIDAIDGIAGPEVVTQPGSIDAPVNGSLQSITAQELATQMDQMLIVDIRGQSEYKESHITGARNIPLGYLPDHLNELPRERPIVVHCASGYRAQIGASLLAANGFDNVRKLEGELEEWQKVLPFESESLLQPE